MGEHDYITYARAAQIAGTTSENIQNLVNNGDITSVIYAERPHIVRQTLQTYLNRYGGPLAVAFGDDLVTVAAQHAKGK